MVFYSTSEVAKKCNVHLQTVIQWARKNVQNKLGERQKSPYIFSEEDVERFINREHKYKKRKLNI